MSQWGDVSDCCLRYRLSRSGRYTIDMSGVTPKRLGRLPRAVNQRERIMHEAAMLFGRSGFDASSLSDLSVETGISKAGIYHYFKTKQDVYDAIILKALQELFEYVSAAVESVDK